MTAVDEELPVFVLEELLELELCDELVVPMLLPPCCCKKLLLLFEVEFVVELVLDVPEDVVLPIW